MEMRYVKVWLDWHEATRRLKDAEKGRLMDAIVAYTKGGDPDQYLTGNEQFVFPMFQLQIDRDRAELTATEEARRKAGIASGEARRTKRTPVDFVEQTRTSANKTNEEYSTKAIDKRPKDKDERLKANTGDIPPVTPLSFERFWAAYPKKVGKGAAQKAFERITGVGVDVMLYAVEQQRHSRQWTENNGQYIPNPATWLNQRRWEDELEEQQQSSGNVFADMVREGVFDDDP